MESYYRAEAVLPGLTAIWSKTGEIMYLAQGTQKAVLIDTCLGVGHLRAFVEKLTDKPLAVLLTHGHVDHAMGAPAFDTVYMNPADLPIYARMSPLAVRKGYMEALLGPEMPQVTEADFVPPQSLACKPLADGDVFDLGGLHLEAYALAGHTPGTMVVLLREPRILILGDACNTATFLFDDDALPVAVYRRNVLALARRLDGRYDRVFLCHQERETSPEILAGVASVCDDILAGRADDLPFAFMGGTYSLAKAVGEKFRRLDGGVGNVIYNQRKVTEQRELSGN